MTAFGKDVAPTANCGSSTSFRLALTATAFAQEGKDAAWLQWRKAVDRLCLIRRSSIEALRP
jgi:hypothetical protein